MLTAEVVSTFRQDGTIPPSTKFGEKMTIIGKDRKGRAKGKVDYECGVRDLVQQGLLVF